VRGTLTLEAPDSFSAEWIAKKFAARIAEMATDISDAPVTAVISSAGGGTIGRQTFAGGEGSL
jgi:chromosomal replication initiation ATPase DnaA